MQINNCLILAAGFGTRMGNIGKVLPKVLWPIFEKSLLELQVGYAKSLGIKNIYINLHHMGEDIERFCKAKSSFENVKFLWERPDILDIGGAVHNLASRPDINYRGNLLILNADQFFYLNKDDFFEEIKSHTSKESILFTYVVNSNSGYNALKVKADRQVGGIIKNQELGRDQQIETYTGISIINLENLSKANGASKFFESVCPLDSGKVKANCLKNVDYWDFGTVPRYWESMFKILKTYKNNSVHPFLRFLVDQRALKSWKINLQDDSYYSRAKSVINLSDKEFKEESCAQIILSGEPVKNNNGPRLWWNGVFDEFTLS